MMGRMPRVFLGLALALLLTLFLCDDALVNQPPREQKKDEAGGGRLKLNGEAYQADVSHLIRETFKPKQSSDFSSQIISATMKRMFGSSHSRQRRSSSFINTLISATIRRQNSLREELHSPPASTTPAPTTPASTTSTTPEPNVEIVTEVTVTGFYDPDSINSSRAGLMTISFDPARVNANAQVADSPLASQVTRTTASSFIISLVASVAFAFSRFFQAG